jgi:hypothetical protein
MPGQRLLTRRQGNNWIREYAGTYEEGHCPLLAQRPQGARHARRGKGPTYLHIGLGPREPTLQVPTNYSSKVLSNRRKVQHCTAKAAEEEGRGRRVVVLLGAVVSSPAARALCRTDSQLLVLCAGALWKGTYQEYPLLLTRQHTV